MHHLLWLQQSARLQESARLATSALVMAMVQGTVLAVAAWAGLRLLPKTPAAVRFAVWFAVFALAVALPVLGLIPRTSASSEAHPLLTLGAGWSLAVAAIWTVASAFRAATLIVAAVRLRALWKRAHPIELPAASQLHPAPARRAQVCVSNEVDRPSVIGFFSPKILLPAWLIDKLTPAELDQVLLHEASHLRRADDWLNLLQKIALVLFPLNPALLWIERRLCFERELACDEQVLRATRAPKAYAQCLAALAEYRMGRQSLALALGFSDRPRRESELGRRVGNILRGGGRMRPLQTRLVMGGALLGLTLGSAGLARCPQIVGFSAQTTQEAIASPAQAIGPSSRYAYQPVVFHPDTPAFRPNADRSNAFHNPRPVINQASTKISPATKRAANDGAPRIVKTAYRAQTAPRPSQLAWLVVETAWDGSQTAHVVLTSADAAAPAPKSDQTSAQPAPQVHPYAAVPSQDGWLVIQL